MCVQDRITATLNSDLPFGEKMLTLVVLESQVIEESLHGLTTVKPVDEMTPDDFVDD